MNWRTLIHQFVAPVSSGSLIAALLGGAVAVAPPAAAAAFDCLSTVSPTTDVTATTVDSDCVISVKGTGISYAWTKPAFVTSIGYLVVGGGGAGALGNGDTHGGGGGGGGGVATASASIAGNLTITVGAGGASYGLGGQVSTLRGGLTVNAYGGGGGTTSRGGSSYAVNSTSTQYLGGYAYSGSTASCNANPYPECSGGGGAGTMGNGGAGTITVTSNNGSGYQSDISGSSQTYGAGGRGGAAQNVSYNGDDGEGEGGSGHSDRASFNYGSKGGSGIVILRFSTLASALTTQPPASAVVDQTLTQSPVVTLEEAGQPASGVSVTAALGTKPTPSGTQITPVLDGTATVTTDGSGLATFDDLSIRGPTGNYTLTFTASGYSTLTSVTISVTVGNPSSLSLISASPTSVPVANPGNTSTVTVQALDAGGNTISAGGATVALAATAGSVGSVTDVGDGTYTSTYTGTSSIADSPVTITGTINAIAITDDASVTLTPGAASVVSITTQPSAGSAYTGQVLDTQPVVRIVDAFGNPRSGDSVAVSLTSGTGTLAGTLTQATDANGYATFTDLQINGGSATSAYTLTFTSGGLSEVSNSFTLAKIPTTVTWAPTNLSADMSASPKQITPNATASVNAGGGVISYSVSDAGTTGCTVDDATGVLTFLTSGTCQVQASAAATTEYAASTSSPVSFVISKVSQTITFGSLTNQTYGSGPYVVSGTTDATGLVLSYSTSTPAVCSVTGSSSLVGGATTASVSLLATGTCTIVAGQPGDETYATATAVPQSFTISQGTQAALSFSSATSVTYGSSLTLQTLGGSGVGAVQYSVTSSGTAGCSVGLTSGVLTYTSVGTCVVQATKLGASVYADVSTSATTITVAQAPQSTTITSTIPSNPLPGDTYTVTSTASSGLATNLSILVGLGTVCSISGSGASETVTFLATGTCTVYASQLGNGDYLPADPEDTQTIEVGALNQSITFGSLTDQAFGSAPFAVSATASSGLTVEFASTTSSVCTATAAGVVTILTVGECRISASQAGNAQYAAASTVVRAFDVVAVVPFAPTLTSISAGDGSITISYTAPSFAGGAAITGYQAVATPSSGPAVTAPCADLTAPLACSITGLANGTPYTVTIAAINSVGVGAASAASAARTPAAAAMAVTDAYAVPGDGTVDLYFSAISTGGLGGGTFTRYEIYRRAANGSWPGTPTTTIASQGSGELTQSYSGLSNGTSYEFKIVVITTANAAEISGNTTIVTEFPSTTPSAPVDLLVVSRSGTSATVSWSIPLSDGGAPIATYSVTATGGATCGTITIDSTTQVATCNMSGLSYSTSYTVTVGAVNRMGTGTTATATYATGADPNPGGDGSGGSGESSGGGSGGNGGNSGGNGGSGGSDGPRAPFPPTVPTPDGPSDEDIEEVLKKPSTGSISELPTLPIVRGTGPMPGGNGQLSSGVRSKVKGVEVMPTSSAELAASLAAGNRVVMASSSAQVGYMTSNRITIAPSTMLQVVTSLEPDDQPIAFRLWMQDRTGAWFRMGRTTSVDGQVVFPVMQFDTPGTYQVIATSVRGPRAVDADGNPVWGSTTVRTVVIVTPRQELGTKLCPNMIAFDQRSAMLSKKTKRQIRKLAECLGAMPAIKVSGYVGQAIRPAAAKRMAYLRARNVRNYLRELGYDGGAKIRTSIELRPASCESTNNRCALVRLELGNERASERAAWDLVAPPEILDDGVAVDRGNSDVGPPAEGAGEPVIAASVDSRGHDPTQLLAQEST